MCTRTWSGNKCFNVFREILAYFSLNFLQMHSVQKQPTHNPIKKPLYMFSCVRDKYWKPLWSFSTRSLQQRWYSDECPEYNPKALEIPKLFHKVLMLTWSRILRNIDQFTSSSTQQLIVNHSPVRPWPAPSLYTNVLAKII